MAPAVYTVFKDTGRVGLYRLLAPAGWGVDFRMDVGSRAVFGSREEAELAAAAMGLETLGEIRPATPPFERWELVRPDGTSGFIFLDLVNREPSHFAD